MKNKYRLIITTLVWLGFITTANANIHRVKAVDVARAIDGVLNTMKMRLNNHKTQNSYLQLLGYRAGFNIPKVVVDIDCGILCPDLGDAHFYLNEVEMRQADFNFRAGAFELTIQFEDKGREIKGYHNRLGDNFVPDFDLRGFKITGRAKANVLNTKKLSFQFIQTKLDASVNSTGGCHVGGVDLCNKAFGTNRKIHKAVETTSMSALNSAQVQTAISLGVSQYLQRLGITAPVIKVTMDREDLVIVTQ